MLHARCWVALAPLLFLTACASLDARFLTVDPHALDVHPRLALVAFDMWDWSAHRSDVPRPDPAAVTAGYDALREGLGKAGFVVTPADVNGHCSGDLGNLCGFLPAADLEPVNLTPALAADLARRLDAPVVLEAHVLNDFAPTGFWSRAALTPSGNPPTHLPEPVLFVRAFDREGKKVWEDQEALALPFTFSRTRYIQAFTGAIPKAASAVVARLVKHLGGATAPGQAPQGDRGSSS